MRAAGLDAIDTIMETEAVLISGQHAAPFAKLVQMIKTRITGILTAQKFVYLQYNLPKAMLEEASKITPGKKAPTVIALEDTGAGEAWVAVSVMCAKKELHTKMDDLEELGATDILV